MSNSKSHGRKKKRGNVATNSHTLKLDIMVFGSFFSAIFTKTVNHCLFVKYYVEREWRLFFFFYTLNKAP